MAIFNELSEFRGEDHFWLKSFGRREAVGEEPKNFQREDRSCGILL